MFIFFQKILLAICFIKKGGPIHLISFGRKSHGLIKNYSLYRRSKVIDIEEHWKDSRLGEISTNWSKLCKSPKDVLYDSSYLTILDRTKPIIDPLKSRVYLCNLDAYSDLAPESYPFIKIIKHNEDSLRIEVMHNQNFLNYPHTDINCYLTTLDGEYKNEQIKAENWDKSPLRSKKYNGLRGKFRTHLIYHFDKYIDY